MGRPCDAFIVRPPQSPASPIEASNISLYKSFTCSKTPRSSTSTTTPRTGTLSIYIWSSLFDRSMLTLPGSRISRYQPLPLSTLLYYTNLPPHPSEVNQLPPQPPSARTATPQSESALVTSTTVSFTLTPMKLVYWSTPNVS